MLGIIKSMFAKNKLPAENIDNVIQSDAAPIPPTIENESDVENNHTINNQAMSLSSSDIPRTNSLTPLKEHRLVELSTQDNQNNHIGVNALQLPQSKPPVQEYHQTNSLNHLNISHSTGVHVGNVTQISINSTNLTNNNENLHSLPNNIQHPLMRNISDSSSPISVNSKYLKKTKTINEMMHSSEQLEHATIDVIATHLKNWKVIARKMGYSEGQIEHFILDFYVNGTKEVIYQMLLDWSRNNDDATLGTITRVLWSLNNQETVYHLKEVWKKLRLQTSNLNSNQ